MSAAENLPITKYYNCLAELILRLTRNNIYFVSNTKKNLLNNTLLHFPKVPLQKCELNGLF